MDMNINIVRLILKSTFQMQFKWIFLTITVNFAYGLQKPDSFEIRSLSGEPNYKSVNLTWEIDVPGTNESEKTTPNYPRSFQIFYCELQSLGSHRCRSKILEDKSVTVEESNKQYSAIIDNLRMATKYSFHIKSLPKKKPLIISGRSENYDNELQLDSQLNGESIVIPTKGFSAQATKCLPHISEIEVETGPYFGGKIVVDGGNCGIKGDIKNPKDKYIMRIDHSKCGSHVKPETNTVETFITVQENLGIFTHSTRRFVVICTFQSSIQTVRASFMVPGKGGVTSLSTDIPETGRHGRERQFRMVDKSGLILKETSSIPLIKTNINMSIENKTENSVGILEDIIPGINEENIKNEIQSDNLIKIEEELPNENNNDINYAMLVDGTYKINENFKYKDKLNSNNTGVVITVSLSVIMVGVFIYILQREFRRKKVSNDFVKHENILNP